MFDQLSTLGWILIIGLAVFILALNLGLFLGVKKKVQKDHWIDKLTDAGRALKNPYIKEDEKLQELSTQIKKLKEK